MKFHKNAAHKALIVSKAIVLWAIVFLALLTDKTLSASTFLLNAKSGLQAYSCRRSFTGVKKARAFFVVRTGNIRQQGAFQSPKEKDIKLVLRSEKKVFRRREKISLAVYLENQSRKKTYYVAYDLNGLQGRNEYHYIELSITSANGKPILIPLFAGHSFPLKKPLPFNDLLDEEYLRLRPGMIHGIKDDVYVTLPPGRYKISGTYKEIHKFSEEEKKQVDVSLLEETAQSNQITVRVIR
jgi:hypothetical protein